jgi:hypothetical protein
MTRDQNERRCAIVYHRGGVGAAKSCEIALEIASALSAFPAGEIKLKIAVVARNLHK